MRHKPGLPFNEPTGAERRSVSLLNKPSCWNAGCKRDKAEDSICPFDANTSEQSSQHITDDGSTDPTTGKDDAIGDTTLPLEVLRGRHDGYHEAQAEDSVKLIE